MPNDFDTSIAENLGNNTTETIAPAPETTSQPEVSTEDVTVGGTNVYEDLNQVNTDLFVEGEEINPDEVNADVEADMEALTNAPEEAVENIYAEEENTANTPETPADANTSIFEDLTTGQDTPTVGAFPTAVNAPAPDSYVPDGSMEGVIFDTEADIDAYFDGNIKTNDNENIDTIGEAITGDEATETPEDNVNE